MKKKMQNLIGLLVGYVHTAAGDGHDEAADIMQDAMLICGATPDGTQDEQIINSIIHQSWNKGASGANLEGVILVATECGKVIKSRWLPKEQRFEMLGDSGIKPHEYWMPYPSHPDKAHEQD